MEVNNGKAAMSRPSSSSGLNYIIVGQGLCGTWLSYYLEQAGQSFMIIDESKPFTASKAASGIINPVTGRRIVKTWMIDELMPNAWEAYTAFGKDLGIDCIAEKPIVDCFATPQMRLAFTERYEKDKQFLSLPGNENNWQQYINYDFGYGIIQPAYLIDIRSLLSSQRKRLVAKDQLREEHFDAAHLQVKEDSIVYKDLIADKIIFCDGSAGFSNPFFNNLPYGLNKGEVILVEVPGLPSTHIIKKGYSLVPWTENTFWLGSTYLWEFDDELPTKGFYQFAQNWLKQTIKLPFTILDHWAALRPATLERKPFVGFHPNDNKLGILNGMGTKGCSLAPFFAKQLVDHLLHNTTIMPDADVQRFKRVLSR
jgi:glycine/D-amino acid oxidase-like deaminating enzyme